MLSLQTGDAGFQQDDGRGPLTEEEGHERAIDDNGRAHSVRRRAKHSAQRKLPIDDAEMWTIVSGRIGS